MKVKEENKFISLGFESTIPWSRPLHFPLQDSALFKDPFSVTVDYKRMVWPLAKEYFCLLRKSEPSGSDRSESGDFDGLNFLFGIMSSFCLFF